jgi:hypothetical protein
MKAFWIFRTIYIASSLAFGCFSLPSHSQDVHHNMTVNVPFGFELGSRHFEPGVYTIKTPGQGIVELQGNSNVGMILTIDGESNRPTKTTKVVFDRYGDHYFLRQIWFHADETTYLECPESKAEKQAKRSELASIQKNASNVELAMLRLP